MISSISLASASYSAAGWSFGWLVYVFPERLRVSPSVSPTRPAAGALLEGFKEPVPHRPPGPASKRLLRTHVRCDNGNGQSARLRGEPPECPAKFPGQVSSARRRPPPRLRLRQCTGSRNREHGPSPAVPHVPTAVAVRRWPCASPTFSKDFFCEHSGQAAAAGRMPCFRHQLPDPSPNQVSGNDVLLRTNAYVRV